MAKAVKLHYQTCREQAGLTQEQAAPLLGIDVSTLSRYENGHMLVSQDLVAAMVKVYRTQTLAWWYVRHSNPGLSKYLPKPPPMSTDGDMMLRLELAEDDLVSLRSALKTILRNGSLSCEEARRLALKAETLRTMASKFMEAAGFLDERVCDVCE